MKLAAFYSFVALAYLALTLSDRVTAEAVFPFVALLLLIAALYYEVLRLRGRRR